MTGMEQGLRYIEMEIRFMVKDQFGNPTYIKYADRVVEDSCGIPSFCTTVLSSKRPLSVILRAVRGPRGDIIMRFFNASLHDARVEMVMVLAESTKLLKRDGRSSREAHNYLMKLYKKAIKRTIRLITGSKSKETYKSLYKGLRTYAQMDDFDLDEYEDDDEYEDYDEDSDFGDSDYAEACLDAYRNGKSPDEIYNPHKKSYPNKNYDLKGNEEMLSEIAAIEAKLGRHLTDSELDKLLCGDDDEDDEFSNLDDLKNANAVLPNVESNLEALINHISDKVVDKISEKSKPKMETFDEFKERMQKEESDVNIKDIEVVTPDDDDDEEDEISNEIVVEPPKENKVVKPMITNSGIKESSISELIRHRNQYQENKPEVVEEATSDESESEELKDSDDEDENSTSAPSDKKLGALDGIFDDFRVSSILNTDYDSDDEDDDEDEKPSSVNLMEEKKSEEKENHPLLAADLVRDYTEYVDTQLKEFGERFNNFIHRDGADLNDCFITVLPSDMPKKLLTLQLVFRIIGDPDWIDSSCYGLMMRQMVINIANRTGLTEEMFDIDYSLTIGHDKYNKDLEKISTGNKTYTSESVNKINQACAVVATYIYKRTNEMVDVRFINDPDKDEIKLYFSGKDGKLLDAGFADFFGNELIEEDILISIFKGMGIDNEITWEIVADNSLSNFMKELETIIKHKIGLSVFNDYTNENCKYIYDWFKTSLIPSNVVCLSYTNEVDNQLILHTDYSITTPFEVTEDQKNELSRDASCDAIYRVSLLGILNAISSSYNLMVTLNYSINEDMVSLVYTEGETTEAISEESSK